MDFFASQELARRNTRKLVFLLTFSIIAIIGSIYILVLLALGIIGERSEGSPAWMNGPGVYVQAFIWTTLTVGAVIAFGMVTKILELRSGGQAIANLLQGRRLQPNSSNLAERRLLNVVEEMALAAGMPVPPVYVLDHEKGINAFAAGHTLDDAVIGVNRGTLEILNRDELQGVIGHEFSHILNGDMRMSLRLIGILHGIQAIAMIGYFLLRVMGNSGMGRSSSRSGKKSDPTVFLLVLGVGLLVIGSIGLFFARLIKASISRQREFLADASSVQFTRNPAGIGGALKMIGLNHDTSIVKTLNAETISHMFFANMNGGMMAGLLSTHPPLVQRITKVEPRFDGDFQEYLKHRAKAMTRAASVTDDEKDKDKERQRDWMGNRFGRMGATLGPALIVSGIGTPTDDDVVYSQILIGNIPTALLEAARDLFLARCLVFASLLDANPDIRLRQMQSIREREGESELANTEQLLPMITSIDPRYRMPIFEILQGTLVGLSAKQYQKFRETLSDLVGADQQTSLFEFFLRHHLVVHLDRHFGSGLPHPVKYNLLNPVAKEVAEILNVLALVGNADEQIANAAYAAGMAKVQLEVVETASTRGKINFGEMAKALIRLSHAAPMIKRQVLEAAATTIAFDHQATVEEAEMFRAFSESLDCPVPPLLANPQSA